MTMTGVPMPAERVAWRTLLALVGVGLLVQWVSVAVAPRGDLLNHVRWAWRLREGAWMYADGANLPYLPFWAVVHVPFTWIAEAWAPLLAWPLGLLAASTVVWTVDRMAAPHLPLPERAAGWATAAGLLLASRYVVRDLFDGGPNLAVLALAWLGLSAWSRGHAWGGLPLGLAIALKLTPLVFLAYLVGRRQWRMVAVTTLVALACTVLPAAWLGLPSLGAHVADWSLRVARGAVASGPGTGVLGADSPIDISLRTALARSLPSAWPPDSRSLVSRSLPVAVAALVAWRMRRPSPPGGARTLWDLAALSVLAVLLSPVSWRQHAVACLPGFQLLARRLAVAAPAQWPVGTVAVLAAHLLLVVVLNRALLGRDWALQAHGWSLHTWSLLALLVLLVRERDAVAGS
jgi:hypothetical protein